MRRSSINSLLVAVLLFSPGALVASTCAPNDPEVSIDFGSTVSVSVIGSYTSAQLNEFYAGVDQWDSPCEGAGFTVESGSGGNVEVSVAFSSSQAPAGVGCGQASIPANYPDKGGTITIYATTSTGHPCDHAGDTVAHEIGHFLGLANVNENDVDSCRGRIMNRRIIVNGTTEEREVDTEDCMEAEKNLEPPDHNGEPEDPGAGGDGTCAT